MVRPQVNGRCVIVGLDGFDPDVLANLVVFYGACGFDTRISAQPTNGDLLVIQRGKYRNQHFETRAQACHIYDYAGLGTSDLHLAFPHVAKCIVIAPGFRVSGVAGVPPNVVRSFHPVIPELWRFENQPKRKRPYDFVHVGHRKAEPAGDAWFKRLDEAARSGSCHFWGGGWHDVVPGNSRMIHGRISLHGSQRIYRQALRALGVMYPFQRELTISGRMWQAPLNGCVLFSEAMIPDRTLPGVELCRDYLELLGKPPTLPNSAGLVEEASEYWTATTVRLAGELGLHFRPPSQWALRRAYFDRVYLRHIRDVIDGRLRQ